MGTFTPPAANRLHGYPFNDQGPALQVRRCHPTRVRGAIFDPYPTPTR